MKKFISFLLVFLFAFSCIAFNASADEALLSDAAANFPVLYHDTCETLSKYLGISDISSYDYIYFYNGPTNYKFIFISPDVSLDDGVYTGFWTDYILFGNSAYQSASSHDIIQATATSYGDIYSVYEVDGELCLTYQLGNVTPIYSTVPLYDYESKDVIIETVSSAIPNPYTVTYNPNLSLSMERETDLMTINTVDVTVHLNHDFIDWYIKRSFE